MNAYNLQLERNSRFGYEAKEASEPYVGPVERVQHFISRNLLKLAKLSFVAGAVFLAISFGPGLYYVIRGTGGNSEVLGRSPQSGFAAMVKEEYEVYQPSLDQTLPRVNTIKIPSVGIETKINEASYESVEEALQAGVWRAPDFGTPYTRNRATILAAHRFGYLKWSVAYRLKNSFFNLPKVEDGDVVEITWKQRKYVYEVYAESKGEDITDYNADLILYTCEALDSPVRIFKYARLLEV